MPSAVPLLYAIPLAAIGDFARSDCARGASPQAQRADRAHRGGPGRHRSRASSNALSRAQPAAARRGRGASAPCRPSFRQLSIYIGMRFLLAIFGVFGLCTVLIFMIDFVELLRQAGKYGSVPGYKLGLDHAARVAGLHRDPAAVRRSGRLHRCAAHAVAQKRACRDAGGRHVGLADPAAGRVRRR